MREWRPKLWPKTHGKWSCTFTNDFHLETVATTKHQAQDCNGAAPNQGRAPTTIERSCTLLGWTEHAAFSVDEMTQCSVELGT